MQKSSLIVLKGGPYDNFINPCPMEVDQSKPGVMEEYSKCGEKLEPFYLRYTI